jgi:hypothetical protein
MAGLFALAIVAAIGPSSYWAPPSFAMGNCQGNNGNGGGNMCPPSGTGGSATATASIFTTVITVISITLVDDMHFGDVAVGNSSGTLTMAPNGAMSATGSAIHISGQQPARFEVGGESSRGYILTLPGSSVIAEPGGAQMVVDGFTTDQPLTGALDAAGMLTLQVGGTLNMNANQQTGTYTGTFDVSVSYN